MGETDDRTESEGKVFL